MSSELAGKTAIVTGASAGIGRAIALALAERGVHLHLTARSESRAEKTAAAARELGVEATAHELELGDRESIARFTGNVEAARTPIDILVNNAATYAYERIEDDEGDSLLDLLRINVAGTYSLTRRLLPRLVDARGDIVLVNSSVVHQTGAGVSHYAAGKHGLKAIADALRAEMNESGIRVLSVFPGRTATPLQESIFEREGRAYHPAKLLQPEDIAGIVVAALGLAATAEVTELTIRPRHKW